MTVGDRSHTASAYTTTPIESGHLGVESGFVDKDQPLDVPVGLLPAAKSPSQFNVGSILLGGARRFFYSSTPGDQADAREH